MTLMCLRNHRVVFVQCDLSVLFVIRSLVTIGHPQLPYNNVLNIHLQEKLFVAPL